MAQPMNATPNSERAEVNTLARNANPLIHGNLGDTIAATRDYVADMANCAALDDQLPRGNTLRLLVVLNALDYLATEKLHHR